ncbi:major intrinsic protein [Azorhizobium oxalatiphilum]|uniref:Major intrinsic protein n=1 Tax=Azorhizobium oxalatiphilum TaxID=980631 RepID=A0A917C696_9HYPH|nr:MIP/aquaporin family protein [Azorhizobium oxalatiphilum]GGF71078.1 major intrinsic protein [Azorhizobium oxalatiphilum]
MHTPFVGELLGTLVLILLGNGVVAGVLLAKSKAQNSGWIVITAGWAFAVMAGVFVSTATGSPDAHLNPAVTLGAAVVTGDWSKLPVYVPAQMIGAFLGAVLVWLQYLPHWAPTEDKGLKLAIFCTGPAIRNVPGNLISEIIGTVALVFIIAAVFSKSVMAGAGIPAGLGPYIVGMVVWAIGLSLGGTTGYAINPARDLGPRIAHAVLPIAGKGGADWGYSWIPVVGPLVGAAIAGLLIKVFI